MSALAAEETVEPVGPGDRPAHQGPQWRVRKDGKEFIPHPDGGKLIFRRGEETIEQAIKRATSGVGDKRPRPKGGKSRIERVIDEAAPPPPTEDALKALEEPLAGMLKMPVPICMMFGDEWGANHFNTFGPLLAKQIIAQAETNPWLRRKIETLLEGGEDAAKVIAIGSLIGGFLLYAGAPVIYYLNLPVPDQGREMLGIPARRRRHAPGTPGAQPAAAGAAQAA